jgi:hypothetical protein
MLLKLGVRTTTKKLVAYKVLELGANEIIETAKLSRTLLEKIAKFDAPSMIVYYDPRDSPNCRREVWIPTKKKIEGIKTKVIDPFRAGFLLMSGTDHSIDYYYKVLYEYLKEQELTPSKKICSVEVSYPPDQFDMSFGDFIDEDAQEEWTIEILIPIKQ